jgi:phage portal protein BeeE
MPPARLALVAREPRLTLPVAKGGYTADQPLATIAGSALYTAFSPLTNHTGVAVTPFSAMQAAAVYACVRCLSEDMAKLPIIISRALSEGGWLADREHPITALLRRPNRWQSCFTFVSYIVTCLVMRGNAYVFVVRDENGQPSALIPISPERCTMRLSPKGWLFYDIGHPAFGSRGNLTVHQDDILHLRNITLDGFTGISTIAAAAEAIGLSLATQQHGANLFRQGTQASGVLKHPGVLGEVGRNNLRESWQERYSSVENAHKVLVLEENMTFEKLSMTSDEAQFLECVTAETLITMADGSRKRADEVAAGDAILGWNDGPVVSRVKHVGAPPEKPLVRVTTMRGRQITTTADHPFLALPRLRTPGGRPVVSPPQWTSAVDLKPGSYVRVCLGSAYNDCGSSISQEAWFLGLMTGDGYLRKGGCALSVTDDGVINAASQFAVAAGGSLRKSHSRSADFDVRTGHQGCSGGYLRRLFNASGLVGRHADTKRVPASIYRGGPEDWRGFLSGYLDADGTVAHLGARQPLVSWSSINRDLLSDCQHLLALLGVQSGLYPASPAIASKLVMGKSCPAAAVWALVVCGRPMTRRVAWLLSPEHDEKRRRLIAYRDLPESRYSPANYEFDRVKYVENLGSGATVGIEVEGVHTHVTNGLVTHNTRKFQVEEICRIFRVPPHKVASLDRATFSNIENQNQQYIDDSLVPMARQLEEEAEHKLFWDAERAGLRLRVDFDSMLRGDMKTRYDAYHTALGDGWLNRDTVRAREGLPPIPGNAGKEYRVALNTGPATAAPATP